LDNDLEAQIPSLDDCWKSAHFYHSYVIANEAATVSLHGLPRDLAVYYELKFREATAEYGGQEA
jgi:hypothetical protein